MKPHVQDPRHRHRLEDEEPDQGGVPLGQPDSDGLDFAFALPQTFSFCSPPSAPLMIVGSVLHAVAMVCGW